jgi:hypothetical protein
MTDRLSPEREAEIAEHLATTTNWSIGNLAARDLLAELAAVRAERDQERARVADAIEYGIRIPDGTVLQDGWVNDRRQQENRLDRYRDTWPEAVLVERPVFHGEWTEAAR